jgi:hypothetical protein
MIHKIFCLLSVIALVTIISCGSDSTNKYTDSVNCTAVPAENTYTKSIKTILDASCANAGCHDAVTKAEGIVLDTYAGAKSTFGSGKGLCSINHDGCKAMPQGGGKFSADVLNIFACWVKNNMPQ